MWEAPVFSERTSVGLDVHARSVVAAAIGGVTGEVFKARLTPEHGDVLRWVQALPGPVAVTYEAGPTGFGLYRALMGSGVRCEVAAPSKLQRPRGDRVKTDQRDAGGQAWTGRHDVWLRQQHLPGAATRRSAALVEVKRRDFSCRPHTGCPIVVRPEECACSNSAWVGI
jgi:transposase